MSFSKHLEQAGRKVGQAKAFVDFLTFAVCCLSAWEKEDLYLKTAKGYTNDEMNAFSCAFAELVEEMENRGEGLKDCLGDYFMDYASNKNSGQFFTPPEICDLMASLNDYSSGESVNDCCCGSARFFLSIAKQNRNLMFYGSDIDIRCCYMSLINMCLNGLFGVVSHMNSLSLEEWRRWEIKKHPVLLIPYIHEIDLTRIKPIEKVEIEEIQETIPKQLELLFDKIDYLL